ncbi:PrgI family protein [Peptoniphilus sp. GNH]|nr:PrgI family protein [Peptoniphilus sp. GNH]
MAYVQVPRDLSKVEAKLALNLTKRQLICFGIGGALGIPTYFILKDIIPTDIASIFAFLIMSPFFLAGVYKKDGIPLEKYLYFVLRQKYYRPHIRTYKTKILIGEEKFGSNKKKTRKKTS